MKTAIVTGSAKGIGYSIAKQLIKKRYFVIIADVDESSGRKAAQDLGKNAFYIKCNVGNEKHVKQLFREVERKYPPLYLVVNNAGIIRDRLIWKMEAGDFDEVINVNLRGTWLMCREASKIMREQRKGKIINIASRAWMGNPGQTNYSASKAGIIGLTRSLALELGRYGVMVNAVAPGLINTPLVDGLTTEVKEKLINAQPTRTMGKPEDIAAVVAFLASVNAEFITGQVFHIDGGKSIGATVA